MKSKYQGQCRGTLPFFTYTTRGQPLRPLDFSTTDDLTARETEVTDIDREAVSFQANSVVVFKRDHTTWIPKQGTLLCWKCCS